MFKIILIDHFTVVAELPGLSRWGQTTPQMCHLD